MSKTPSRTIAERLDLFCRRAAELEAIAGPAASLTRFLFLDFIAEVIKVVTWTHSVIEQARDRGALRNERLPESTFRAHPHVPQPSRDDNNPPVQSILIADDGAGVEPGA